MQIPTEEGRGTNQTSVQFLQQFSKCFKDLLSLRMIEWKFLRICIIFPICNNTSKINIFV